MADDAICLQIRALLTPKFASRRISLRFSYNGRTYTTVFQAAHDDTELRITTDNHCIDITYNYETLTFLTNIQADSSTSECFTPRLVSNARNLGTGIRTTTIDVLAVLMTKLCTCFPESIVRETPITLTDMATKDEMNLSAFHLLRGGHAIYEKYGYTSPSVAELRERIKTLRWRDLNINAKQLLLKLSRESGLGGNYRNDDRFVDIVKPITYEIERAFNQHYFMNPANNGEIINFSEYMIIYLTQDTGYDNDFTLNPLSPEWADWSSRLLLTEVKEIPIAGGRHGRKGQKTRRLRRWRRRV